MQVETIETIADAQSALAVLNAFDKEVTAVVAANVNSLKKLGVEIQSRKYERFTLSVRGIGRAHPESMLNVRYETPRSSYTFENPSLVQSIEVTVDNDMDVLHKKSTQKRQTLDISLKLELEKEECRLDYSNKANNFSQYVDDTCLIVMPIERDSRLPSISARSRRQSLVSNPAPPVGVDPADAPFGATLREIDESAKAIAVDDTQITTTAAELLDICRETKSKLDRLNVNDNQYVFL